MRLLDSTFARVAIFPSVIALAFLLVTSASRADSGHDRPSAMQSLDQQIQDIKSDVLEIASELRGLEEKLLYPSNSQVALFVNVKDSGDLALDSARISIDGNLVAQHIYSFKEIEALRKGGVQHIYTGNVSLGEHRIDVEVKGKRAGNHDFESTEQFVFRKEIDPKNVGITLTAGLAGTASIAIGDW